VVPAVLIASEEGVLFKPAAHCSYAFFATTTLFTLVPVTATARLKFPLPAAHSVVLPDFPALQSITPQNCVFGSYTPDAGSDVCGFCPLAKVVVDAKHRL
jgi:hypothetical protein